MVDVIDDVVSGAYRPSLAVDDGVRYEAMLPGFIIEEIKRQERERRKDNRVPLHIDIDDRKPVPTPLPRKRPDIDGDRGVVEIIGPDEDVYDDTRVNYSLR